MKNLYCFILCIVTPLACFSQDKIYLKTGHVVHCHVTVVADKYVGYKLPRKRRDSIFAKISSRRIKKIVYGSGHVDNLVKQKIKHLNSSKKYGENIISIAPLQGMDDLVQNTLGFAVCYERMLNKYGTLCVYIPAIYRNSSTDLNMYYQKDIHYTSYYFLPGIKYYPAGSRGVVRYALGGSLIFGGGSSDNAIDSYGNHVPSNYSLWGFMINNSVNICPFPYLYFGLEIGIGVAGINKENVFKLRDDINALPVQQYSFKVGYRF
ncbi:MAG: hypothetical protein ACTHJ0_11175 [Flavipsychrobacter sp.]